MVNEGDLLFVEMAGFDESLEEVQEHGFAILNACLLGNHTLVLCNELNLEYHLGAFDTFQSAVFMAAQVLKLGKAAIVCNEKFTEDAKFWEMVSVNRGLTVCVFTDEVSARSWLGEK